MTVLVLNAGSSSFKLAVFDLQQPNACVFQAVFEHFTHDQCHFTYQIKDNIQEKTQPFSQLNDAVAYLPELLRQVGLSSIEAIGHRIPHGGPRFHQAILLDDAVLKYIESLTPLAPLHNPPALKIVAMCRLLWPNLPQVGVFDTAFHHTIPEYAYTYAVPKDWRDSGLRRYGFHGTSHAYVGLRVAQALKKNLNTLNIISCHLGNGASVCAIHHGFSLDTSMGMTPLEGLVMGTRSGDIDPGAFGYLSRTFNLSIAEIERLLYTESGLKALSGHADLRDIEAQAAKGDEGAQLALQVYAYRVRKYIGAYAAAMGGCDALVFTGGVGEHSATMRRRICEKLSFFGLILDHDKNENLPLKNAEAIFLHSDEASVPIWVIPSNEALMIAHEVQHLLSDHFQAALPKRWHVPVAVSARHVHLSQADVERLFGPGHQLHQLRALHQPEGWVAEETVEIIGPKGSFPTVRVLGPPRSQTQIEVSRTDTFVLGLEVPVRVSGHLDNTPSIILRGPAGEIRTSGLMIAARHIHLSPTEAAAMGLKNGDLVHVELGEGPRAVSFNNTQVRVKEGYATEMHIDTDEANAAGIDVHTEAELIVNDARKQAKITAKRNRSLIWGEHP